MGFDIINTPSATAPSNLEAGLVPARFDGFSQESHPEWAGDGKFGYDDGERLRWDFTLVDANGEPITKQVAGEDVYEEGDPVELTVNALNGTNLNTKSDKSKNALWLKALSPEAFAAVDAGKGFASDKLVGLPCMLLIEIKENGWPKVTNVLPAMKKR